MRGVTSYWIALVLVGCNKPADRPADTSVGEAPAMEAAPPTVSLADLAGTWHVRATVEGNESQVVTYDLVATADRSGWSVNFPNRRPIPVRIVAVEGDSIVSEAGPFESVLRKGVQVRTHYVSRLQDGKLVGTTVARYQVTGPDTVARLRHEGVRAP
jgi:hypothetical protein